MILDLPGRADRRLPSTPHYSLYAEALRVRASYGGHVTSLPDRTRYSDADLAAWIDAVLVARPDAWATGESLVAIWLHRISTSPERFHRVWQVQATLDVISRLPRPIVVAEGGVPEFA